jgi:carbamoyl-phosphate synthase large subunit
MPKNTEISTILIIGAGPIVVGQACEFDYSGTQGAKALKEEGYRVILVNSNPATIMTDPAIADATYLEPITTAFITQIIEKERPDAILPTLGGQTALNVTLELDALGVLKKYGVKLLGANVEAINIAEDRGLFKKAMAEIGIECPRNVIVTSLDEALCAFELNCLSTQYMDFEVAKLFENNYHLGNVHTQTNYFDSMYHHVANKAQIDYQDRIAQILNIYPHLISLGLPAIIRPSLTLGGTGGGVANTIEEFITLVKSGLDASPINQIQIDESLIGWKEYEMEVIRDRADNAIIVCSIENIDPMGIHTGDSITVAPILTLTDKEYQIMRNASIAILRKVGVETGGSNVQFAVNPKDGRMVVIEMNPRVSRSSALASKATGFPIAKVAAKLAVGYTLDELRNDIACFIPKEFEYVAFKQVMEAISKTKQNGEKMGDCAKYLAENEQYAKIFQYIKTQLAQGVSELKLSQQVLPASFEPAIDYVVVKIPKFNFEKFSDIKNIPELGTQMQSIGEVMAIGRSFEESFLKAVSSMEEPWDRLEPLDATKCKEMLKMRIPNRFLYIFRAFELGISNDEIIEITQYDPWFIERFHKIYEQFQKLASTKENAKSQQFKALSDEEIFEAKHYGIRDLHIRERLEIPAGKKGKHLFKDYRISKNIRPVFKKVDTCANEFATKTNYFYSTYEEGSHNEAPAILGKKCIIVGSGPNRIGQGIEFDYACVHGAYALKEIGIEPIIVNCNPETVSTDYDTSTRLYFEPITDEHIMAVVENELEIPCNAKINGKKVFTIFEIYQEAIRTDFNFEFAIDDNMEKVASRTDFSQFLSHYISVIIQFGGQTPLKLRETLFEYGIPILGMQNDTIDICDHREKFSPMLDSLGLKYPKTYEFTNKNELEILAETLNYNFIIRPSSVIGGRGMAIITTKDEFDFYEYVSGGIVNEMLQDATEFDCDAIRDQNGNVFICGVMEHIEFAGVHSGDSACVLPPYSASLEVQNRIEETTYKIAQKLGVIGLINIQYAVKNGEVFVIEANPRCSRTMPFIAKASGFPIIKVATKLMNGMLLEEIYEFQTMKFKENVGNFHALRNLPHYAVKEAVFSFEKFPNADLILGPEMKSTGEIIGISKNINEAFAKAIIATKYKLPKKGVVFVSLKDADKSPKALAMVQNLHKNGFEFYSTKGTQEFLQKNGIECKLVKKASEGSPNVLDMIAQKSVHLIINTTHGRRSLTDAFAIRRATVMSRLLYATTLESAVMIASGIDFQNENGGLKIFTSLQEIV